MKQILSFFFLLIFSGIAIGQSPSKVIGKANKALGGEKALKMASSWKASGKIKRISDGAGGDYKAQAGGNGLYAEAYDLNGFEVASGYNGKSGWARDSKDGLRTLTGDAARDFQAEALFKNSRWLNAKANKTKIVLADMAEIGGKKAQAILLTTAKGAQMRVYFDLASGLPLREEIPQGSLIRQFDFSDYKPINGIQFPHAILARWGDESFEIKLDSISLNPQVAKADFDFPRLSDEPLPDIKALLDEVRANADKLDGILDNYSFTETRIDREMDKTGNLFEKSSETNSLTFYKGYRIKRLIAKNGRPLSLIDQEGEDRKIEKQIAEIEKRIAEKERKQAQMQRDNSSGATGAPSGEGQRITISDALKGSILINPRRERFRGKEVIVFDYEPNPAFKPQSRMEKLFALCNGAVWVDSAAKQVVRLDAVLTQSAGSFLAKAKRGASFSLENELINNEIWLPSRADINLSIKILFAGININNIIKYGDYKRFETEVKDAKVDEAKKP